MLFSTFHIDVAGPRRTPPGSATTLELYSTGESVSTYTVTWPDGHVDHPTVTTPITTDSYTISSGYTGEQTVSVTATSTASHNATAVYALDSDFGNFPGSGGGENVFTPTSSTSSTPSDVLVDTAHSDNIYTIESYTPSGACAEFGITRLSSAGVIDTTFGQTGHTGTYVVPSFGGGNDRPYGAYLTGTTMVIVGQCADGWAAASIDVSGAGSANWNTGTTFYTSGRANAVYVDSSSYSYIVGTNGTNMTAIKVDSSGAKVSGFGTSGVKIITFPTSYGSDALAVTAEPYSFTGDIILGGWENDSSCSGCYFAIAALCNTGTGVDTGFGSNGYCTVNVGHTAYSYPIHGCCTTGTGSHDAAYSLVYDYDSGDLMAIGTTDALGGYVAVAAFNSSGNLDTSNFSKTGLGVSTANGTGYGGMVDNVGAGGTPGTYYGKTYAAGTDGNGDFLVDRFLPFSSSNYAALDTTFGSAGEDTLDFGTTSANTTDTAIAVGVESDETAVVGGQTTSSTGSIAVARFLQRNTLLIATSGNGPVGPAAFSSGPAIFAASDSGTSNLIASDPTALDKLRHRCGPRALLMG